ncbi:hypothetical protein FGO68_gene4020 [Halteria grandinella]|uniref:Uncharacterized protein n=1 Tax=Halteria grandinella TaxID=5974 RepID=A0A8J8SXJ7_HALGN|nr:hypothetical protein FGO68_gene4020 [Halteria grandinella]
MTGLSFCHCFHWRTPQVAKVQISIWSACVGCVLKRRFYIKRNCFDWFARNSQRVLCVLLIAIDSGPQLLPSEHHLISYLSQYYVFLRWLIIYLQSSTLPLRLGTQMSMQNFLLVNLAGLYFIIKWLSQQLIQDNICTYEQ